MLLGSTGSKFWCCLLHHGAQKAKVFSPTQFSYSFPSPADIGVFAGRPVLNRGAPAKVSAGASSAPCWSCIKRSRAVLGVPVISYDHSSLLVLLGVGGWVNNCPWTLNSWGAQVRLRIQRA